VAELRQSPTSRPLSDTAPIRAITSVIGAQYRISRLIGEGGMAAVYLAHDTALDRQVAVKVLTGPRALDPRARQRFVREARIAASLAHPNIVPLHAFGAAEDALFYIMGYVEGETLGALLDREGRLSAPRARRIIRDICGALEYAHALGIVHRDLKPDNILIDRATGRAMLSDFGIAKLMVSDEELTRTGAIVGTPHYLSPEQAQSERELDGRSDIYSLGIIIYRMIAGRLPFESDTAIGLVSQHIHRDPQPLAHARLDAPRDVVDVVARAMAKNRDDRWRSAAELRDALGPDIEVDVADRLPDEIVRWRATQTTGTNRKDGVLVLTFVSGVVLLLLSQYSLNRTLSGTWIGEAWRAIGAISLALLLGGLYGLFLSNAARRASRGEAQRLFEWLRDHDVGAVDARRMLTEPTVGSTFWFRPHIAALLRSLSPNAAASDVAAVKELEELAEDARERQPGPQG
jgi:serine/threonine protein kinase